MKTRIPTPAIARRRLLKLAEFLEKLPRHRFDFSTFVGEGWKGAQDLSCGTTACGMGWAVTLFGKQCDVKLRRDPDCPDSIFPAPIRMRLHDVDEGIHIAGERMFALSAVETERLFIPRWAFSIDGEQLPATASAKQLAKHIRKFVEKKYGKAA